MIFILNFNEVLLYGGIIHNTERTEKNKIISTEFIWKYKPVGIISFFFQFVFHSIHIRFSWIFFERDECVHQINLRERELVYFWSVMHKYFSFSWILEFWITELRVQKIYKKKLIENSWKYRRTGKGMKFLTSSIPLFQQICTVL